ncbi:hypothetical protein IscW_ISCW010206 [Ixodes scapularis]|uniref:Uncharacterized protein n=1 Tax=Ixodes scapularis TaxID=6945 RepID=B7Q086_IXOSC|nr:hypothetical protein IscW_ISCW010206 [Ixodes scapularis]|eukprot:XP_002407207.1 hypothetical protein IscW_ISCW010206 [Ixodes scapularis]
MLPQLQLTEHMLNKLEHGDNKVVLGPYPAVDCLSASNRTPDLLGLLACQNWRVKTPNLSGILACYGLLVWM